MEKQPPNIDSRLRHILRMPQEIYQASGIIVNGRRLKSFVFTLSDDPPAGRNRPPQL